jgi:predicted Zn-dependent protease
MVLSLIAAMCTVGYAQPSAAIMAHPQTKPAADQKVLVLPNNKEEDTFDLPTDPKHKQDLVNDAKEGAKGAAEVIKAEKLSKNQEYQDRVERIGQIVAHIANHNLVTATWGDKRLSPYHYRYNVLCGDEINAFSLPGGYIFVYEGLMKFVESDDELAGVLAHETAHAAFRHVPTLEHESNKNLAIEIPTIIAAILTRNPAAMEMGQLAAMSNESGWSINAEKAADYGGFQYMTKSQYNPVAMLTFMERLAAKERYMTPMERTLGVLQTHPLTKQRAEAMETDLQQFGIPIQRSKASPTFRVLLKDGPNGSVFAYFDNHKIYTFGGLEAQERAHYAVNRLNRFFDAVPGLYDVSTRDNMIVWHGEMLLTVLPEDAEAAKMNQELLVSSTLGTIKNTLASLGYRVWDGL